jgi:ribosomal protein L10
MNNEEKGKRYDWLLEQYKQVERQINRVPKLPLEETLQSLDSSEYSPQNQQIINQLKMKLNQIDNEVKRLF